MNNGSRTQYSIGRELPHFPPFFTLVHHIPRSVDFKIQNTASYRTVPHHTELNAHEVYVGEMLFGSAVFVIYVGALVLLPVKLASHFCG